MPNSKPLFITAYFWLLLIHFSLVADNSPLFGHNAPEFHLQDLNGKVVNLTTLTKQTPVLLVFWSSHCPVCHMLIPQFKNIDKQYSGKIQLLAINVGIEKHEQVRKYIAQNKITYTVLSQDDKKLKISKDYRLIATPTIILVNKSGKILFNGHRLPDLNKVIK